MPKADRLSPGAVKLLQEAQIGNFATVMADSSPQLTPVWVDVEDDGSYVMINTAEGRVKTKNVVRNPRVAISVVDTRNPWRYALIRGRIVERTHEGADQHIDKLAYKYLGKETYPFRRASEQRVILKIKPDHVIELGVDEKS